MLIREAVARSAQQIVLALVIMFELRHLPLTGLFFFNRRRDRTAAVMQKQAVSFQVEYCSVS